MLSAECPNGIKGESTPKLQTRTTSMQLNLKLASACLFLFVGAIVASANVLPARREVKYGSGYVEKRNFGNCQLDPGAVCGGLASACAAALMASEVNLVWQIVACTCAGLW